MDTSLSEEDVKRFKKEIDHVFENQTKIVDITNPKYMHDKIYKDWFFDKLKEEHQRFEKYFDLLDVD